MTPCLRWPTGLSSLSRSAADSAIASASPLPQQLSRTKGPSSLFNNRSRFIEEQWSFLKSLLFFYCNHLNNNFQSTAAAKLIINANKIFISTMAENSKTQIASEWLLLSSSKEIQFASRISCWYLQKELQPWGQDPRATSSRISIQAKTLAKGKPEQVVVDRKTSKRDQIIVLSNHNQSDNHPNWLN